MKTLRLLLGALLLIGGSAAAQTTYYMQGLLRQPDYITAQAYLKINTNGGSGTVTTFSIDNFSPLFNTSVATPTTTPHVSFAPISQAAHTFYAAPLAGGNPVFRTIDASDLPGGGFGTVTSFSSGNLSPLFTTSVATPTTTPALSYTLNTQGANLVFAGPTSGGAAAPTFRSLVSGDIPSLSSIYLPLAGGTMSGTITGPEVDMTTVKADNLVGNSGDTVKLNGPLELNDAAANGQIVARDGTTTLVDPVGNHFGVFNGSGLGLSNVVFSVTNASLNVDPSRITMINRSNTPANGIVAMKSISAGANVTLTDQGTNVVIGSTGGGGGGGLVNDYYMTNLTAYANSSNYFIDFNFPSAILTSATNVIAFNYSTNWGLANTSRVCNISIPPTNFGRIVTFTGLATNWHVQPMVYFVPLGYGARFVANQFGQGETNVSLTPFIDSVLTTSNTTASFNPTNAFPNSGGLGAKVWLDASVKAWQDEYLTVPVIDGAVLRGWTDLSGYAGLFTNMITTELNTFYRAPQTGPYNVPCMRIYPGQSGAFCWLQAPSVTAISQPTWGFVMYYGRSGGNVFDATSGGRFAINPGQMGQGSSFFCSAGISYTAAKTVSWTLVSCEGNGVNGIMRTNGVQAVTGNSGTTSPSQFIIFGDNVKTVMVGEYHVAEILILNTNLTATQLTNVESYFYRKYPFWNPPTVQ